MILALDLATAFGAAWGPLGGPPRVTSGRFAGSGAKHAHVGAEAVRWLNGFLAINPPSHVFIERPHLASIARGHTGFDVIYRLLGLAFTVQAVAYLRGVPDTRLVKVEDVRKHFLGTAGLKGDEAKRWTQRRCAELGWEHKNADEADALAIWSYGCEQIRPGSGQAALPGLNLGDVPTPRRLPTQRVSYQEARKLLQRKR